MACGKIERWLVAQLAGNAELMDQGLQASDGTHTDVIGAGRPFEAVNFGQLGKGAIDFPQQHRRTCCGAAASGQFAIDDDDIEALAGKSFGDQRSGDAATNDQRIAFEIVTDLQSGRRFDSLIPGRVAATQVGLFGIF
jgi:hypothetical protein